MRSATLLLPLVLAAVSAPGAGAQCPGTPGVKGVPRLAIDKASLGTNMALDLYNAKNRGFYFLVVTAGGTPTPTPLGTICLNLARTLFVHAGYLDVHGEATHRLPIFNLASLLGFPINAQAAILDAANPTGYALTNGVAQRVTAPTGYLCGAASTGGVVNRIDVRTGAVLDTVFVGNRPVSVAVAGKAGRYVYAGSHDGGVYRIDYGVTPPSTARLPLQTGNPIYGIGITRDGRFAYCSAHGMPPGSLGVTWVVDVDPLSRTFFTVLGPVRGYPAGHSEIIDTKASPDRRVVVNGVHGLGNGKSFLSKVDADPYSPAFNTCVGSVHFPTGWGTEVGVRPGNACAYLSLLNFAFQAQVGVVNLATMACVDSDPIAPGCQPLGGEQQVPRTPLGQAPFGLSIDALGRYLYLVDTVPARGTNAYKVYRLDVNPQSPRYHQVTGSYSMPVPVQPLECAVSPDGSKLLVGYNSAPHATILDTVSGAVVRHLRLAYGNLGVSVK